MKQLTDTCLMPFGKFKDEKMGNVPAWYLDWLDKQGCNNLSVADYIMRNRDSIAFEMKNEKNKR